MVVAVVVAVQSCPFVERRASDGALAAIGV